MPLSYQERLKAEKPSTRDSMQGRIDLGKTIGRTKLEMELMRQKGLRNVVKLCGYVTTSSSLSLIVPGLGLVGDSESIKNR